MHQNNARRAAWVVAISTGVRLLIASTLPLGIDESYAVVVARQLSLSYFDHPPAVFWIAHVAALLGGESAIALRLPFVLLFSLTTWLLFLLTTRLFGSRAGFWAVFIAQCIPVFSLSSGSWVLPDGPLLLAAVAAALALVHAAPLGTPASRERRADDLADSRWFAWISLGLALGIAGLSKYHAALLGLGVCVFLSTDAVSRRWLSRPQPWVAAGVAALCALPVFLWNAQHGWVSFRFQAGRAAGDGNGAIALLQNLAGQAGYLFPWFWVPLLVLVARALRTGTRDRRTWCCACLGAPPVIVFTLAALGGRAGLPHWPAPGYFMLLPLLGDAVARWEGRSAVLTRRWMAAAVAVWSVLLMIVVTHAASGWMARVIPSLHRRDPAFELVTYQSLRDSLDGLGLLDGRHYLATNDWIRGAKIGSALGPGHPVLVLNDDARHFRFSDDGSSLLGKDGLLIVKVNSNATKPESSQAAEPFRSLFDNVQFVRTVPILRGADTALLVSVFTTQYLRRPWLPSLQR